MPSYAASKHGLLGMTRALANEWATDRIRVNAIAPGYMETELTAAHREDPAKAENMLRRIPIGHWGDSRRSRRGSGLPRLGRVLLRHRHRPVS